MILNKHTRQYSFMRRFTHMLLPSLILLTTLPHALAGDNEAESKRRDVNVSPLAGLNFKLMPAIYWGTVGLEIEYPVSRKMSFSGFFSGTIGKKGGPANPLKVRKDAFLDQGITVDLIARYFFTEELPPEGFYGQAHISYNSIMYYDGTTRPFTLHSRREKVASRINTPPNYASPQPWAASLGVGYQLVIIPRHVIVNASLMVQGQMDHDNTPFFSLYFSPSIGYVF